MYSSLSTLTTVAHVSLLGPTWVPSVVDTSLLITPPWPDLFYKERPKMVGKRVFLLMTEVRRCELIVMSWVLCTQVAVVLGATLI